MFFTACEGTGSADATATESVMAAPAVMHSSVVLASHATSRLSMRSLVLIDHVMIPSPSFALCELVMYALTGRRPMPLAIGIHQVGCRDEGSRFAREEYPTCRRCPVWRAIAKPP